MADRDNEVFVVADAHGRLDLIEGLLEHAGASRGPGRTIVQLGDLVNCVASSVEDDLATLRAAPDLFDVLLVGNHEHPYFGGSAFAGFRADRKVEKAIQVLAWRPAFASGEFLISHAGLTCGEWDRWRGHPQGAGGVICVLEAFWRSSPGTQPVFARISRQRGGKAEWGGILWADWSEPKSTAGFSQIVGHTPGPIRVQGQCVRASHSTYLGERENARFVDGRPEGFEPDEHFVLGIDLGASKGGRDYADPGSRKVWPRGDSLAGCWIRGDKVEVVVWSAETAAGEEIAA